MSTQHSGPLYGPPAPHIAFFFGERYLGEVRGHPSDVQGAMFKLLACIDVLEPGDRENKRGQVLNYSHARVICGATSRQIQGRDWGSALYNPYERHTQLRKHGHIVY